MANIEIKRGQDTSVDVEYKLGGQTSAVDLSGSGYDVELVIRRKRGSLYDGPVNRHTLRFGDSSPADSAKDNRITLHATAPNIKLFWNTNTIRVITQRRNNCWWRCKNNTKQQGCIFHKITI